MIWTDLRDILKNLVFVNAKLDGLIEDDAECYAELSNGLHNHLSAIEARQEQRFQGLSDRLSAIEAALIPPEAARFVFISVSGGVSMEVSSMQMGVDKVCTLKIAPVDKFGNAAKVDGVPAWSLNNPAMGALVVDADGMGAVFTPAGAVGSVNVQVNADADLGEGVKTIAGELPLDILAGEAVSVNVSGSVS